ncbi:hypothetical protein [Tenacibaculum singaporense]|uniref:hypothetical protein n=1 Tax=Tenacibaculum singaporense TaxID=2358479 RepID=UPI000F677E47|nr:hypothetical protein [Tenacibaculum singaporense]RSC96042.1 hypothetical protein EI424_02675 [Tenacibaculum singaporense]
MNIVTEIKDHEIWICIIYDKKRHVRNTKIQGYEGGSITKLEKEGDYIVYSLDTLRKKEETENGFKVEFNIRLTNYLDFFIYKMVKSIVMDKDFKMFKVPKDFKKITKEQTRIKIK